MLWQIIYSMQGTEFLIYRLNLIFFYSLCTESCSMNFVDVRPRTNSLNNDTPVFLTQPTRQASHVKIVTVLAMRQSELKFMTIEYLITHEREQ
jgi:hypothetical protein